MMSFMRDRATSNLSPAGRGRTFAMHRCPAFHLSPLGRGRSFAIHGEAAGEGGLSCNSCRLNPLTPALSAKGRGGRKRRSLSLYFISSALLLCCNLQDARAEVDHAAIARAALQDVIRPGFTALAEKRRRAWRQGRRAVPRAFREEHRGREACLRRGGGRVEQGRDPALRADHPGSPL